LAYRGIISRHLAGIAISLRLLMHGIEPRSQIRTMKQQRQPPASRCRGGIVHQTLRMDEDCLGAADLRQSCEPLSKSTEKALAKVVPLPSEPWD